MTTTPTTDYLAPRVLRCYGEGCNQLSVHFPTVVVAVQHEALRHHGQPTCFVPEVFEACQQAAQQTYVYQEAA